LGADIEREMGYEERDVREMRESSSGGGGGGGGAKKQ